MLDVSVSYNRYQFIGHEFLTWLWFVIENQPRELTQATSQELDLNIGNRIMLINQLNEGVESITIKGDDAGLEEGLLALRKGAVVVELNLNYSCDELKWQFTLKGESLNVSNLKCPDTQPPESEQDTEATVLEKTYLLEKVLTFIDRLFAYFVRLRISNQWSAKTVPQIKQWIAV